MNNKHVLVTSWNPELIARFKNQTFIIQTGIPEEIPGIQRQVSDHNGLFCIQLVVDQVMSNIPFDKSWKEIPVFINCRGLGNFREFIRIKPLLAKLNVKIFFPADSPGQFTSVKILASLGIPVGIILHPDNDWEMVNDLMVYSVYSRSSHAEVEPFHYMMEHYDPLQMNDPGTVYFNNPEKFLFIDMDENIAVSKEALDRGEFLGKGAEALTNIGANELYIEAVQAWQEYFMKTDGCAYCKAWRVCLGKFHDPSGTNQGCVNFFSDLMDTADNYKKIRKNGR